MDPIITAGLISAGSSLLGGVLGRNAVKKTTSAEMRAKILTGKEFGLHPLASIGASSGGGYTGSYLGEGIAQAGAAAAQAVRDKADKKDPLRIKEAELLDAQVEEARSRTRLNDLNAARSAGLDPFAPRKENALIQVKLENGEVVWVPNPDVYEIGPSELATGRTMLEGARVVGRVTANSPPPGTPEKNFPKDPTLGQIYRPSSEPRYEYQFTRQGWRQRKRRD